MFSIIGIIVVIGAVIGGFLMEKGPMPVLMQPSEFLIIGGAALGTLLSANPLHVIKKIIERPVGCSEGVEIFEAALHRLDEDDVHALQQSAQRGPGGH